MTVILKIEASARKNRSLSRQLSQHFINQWMAHDPKTKVIEKDVGTTPPEAISEDWIAAVFTPSEERTPEQKKLVHYSDQAIKELNAADVIVISTPMYNYGMPAALKAWFDQVIRVNETFSFDLKRGDRPLEPILRHKQLVILSSCGEFGFHPGGINESANHLVPHIKTVSKYLGVETTYHIGIEYQEFGDERHEQSKIKASKDAIKLAQKLSTPA